MAAEEDIVILTEKDLKKMRDSVATAKRHKFRLGIYFSEVPDVDRDELWITNRSIYSTTWAHDAENLGKLIAGAIVKYPLKDGRRRISQMTITDATANVGGDTISLNIQGWKRVNSFEIDPLTCSALKHNLGVYGLPTKFVHCADYVKSYKTVTQDVIYFDPPWGGPDYIKKEKMTIRISGRDIGEFSRELLDRHCEVIALKLPKNYDFDQLDAAIGPVRYRHREDVRYAPKPTVINYVIMIYIK